MKQDKLTFKSGLALLLGVSAILLTGCSSASQVLNPFHETPPPHALYGDANDHALNDTQGKEDVARESLEAVGKYPRAHSPKPVNPVIQPAVVRLMWIPDHLNPNGDLVPAHYYYLRVLEDRWAVTDVFDQKRLLGEGQKGSHIPFTTDSKATR